MGGCIASALTGESAVEAGRSWELSVQEQEELWARWGQEVLRGLCGLDQHQVRVRTCHYRRQAASDL
jgi:hypothetical protein